MAKARLVAIAMLLPFSVQAQSFTALYAFKGGNDGAQPTAGLTYASGFLYGTTWQGGGLGCSGGGCGTTFKVDATTGTERVLHRFVHAHGGFNPLGALAQNGGLLYGTTEYGGFSSGGVVFTLDPATATEAVLHHFRGTAGGDYPQGGLIFANGALYGTTWGGGTADEGSVFRIDPATGKEAAIYSFRAGNDGAKPSAGLAYHEGVVYGTSTVGGAGGCGQTGGCGTIFKLDLNTATETVLHAFTGGSDGAYPAGGLIYLNGALYGTTPSGGPTSCDRGCGVVFSINSATGAETVLHGFTGGTDGAYPYAAPIYLNGILYGTTLGGGGTGCGGCYGTVFSVNPATGTETIMHSFTGGSDGASPEAPLVARANVLYGTTTAGGSNYSGVVFALTP